MSRRIIRYTKPHATPTQRIAHLQSRGLIIPDVQIAEKEIEQIGYERLRIYLLSRRQTSTLNKPFQPNTTFHDIIQLYICDDRIRAACFSAVGRFETLFKNAISETLSLQFSSHPYDHIAAFKDSDARIEAQRDCIKIYLSSRDQRARHYRTTYSDPVLPPIWTLKEFMTFGQAVHLFNKLSHKVQSSISSHFNVHNRLVFASWLGCMVDLRNMCAHHDRVFNRRFQKQPSTLKKANIPTAPVNTLKAQLECLDYLLQGLQNAVSTVQEVDAILNAHPQVQRHEVGY